MRIRTAGVQRRDFLRALLAGAAAASVPAWAIDPARYDHPWIPDDVFLGDLPEWLDRLGVPGVGIAVVEAGEVAWTHSAGIADTSSGRAVTESSVFECASLSKPVFACLVLQLIDEGRLRLEDRLVDHLRPDYHDTADARLNRITVHDVLRHTSGLPNWRTHPDREPLRTEAEPARALRYSGEAFFWLQLIVERICDAGLDRIAQQRLFAPAGMHRSTFTWNANAARESVAGVPAPGESRPAQTFREQWPVLQAIADRSGKPLADWRWADGVAHLPEAAAASPPGRFVWAGDLLANSAASLRGPVSDYARFLIWAMRGEAAPHGLKDRTRALMFTPQFAVTPGGIDKGLGWNLERIGNDQRWCFHGGSNAGLYKAFVVGDPLRQRGIVVMANGGGATGLYQRVIRAGVKRDLLAFDL